MTFKIHDYQHTVSKSYFSFINKVLCLNLEWFLSVNNCKPSVIYTWRLYSCKVMCDTLAPALGTTVTLCVYTSTLSTLDSSCTLPGSCSGVSRQWGVCNNRSVHQWCVSTPLQRAQPVRTTRCLHQHQPRQRVQLCWGLPRQWLGRMFAR